MVTQDDFKTRLEQIMAYYDLSATALADKIQVQRSGISHILGGRNKPSLDFVIRLVTTFEAVSFDWLLTGKGDFPKQTPTPLRAKKPQPAPGGTPEKPVQIIRVFEDGSFDTLNPK